MNQPLGRVTLDAARAALASARLAREDFMANRFTDRRCGKTMMASCSGVRLVLYRLIDAHIYAFADKFNNIFAGPKEVS